MYTGALRPRASPVPGAQQQQGCTPRTGVLRVGDQGFLSRATNPFGEYLVTRDRADALTVVLGCDDRNLRSTVSPLYLEAAGLGACGF